MTIATRNGSQAHRAHNIRDPRCVDKEYHIDPQGRHETWLDINPREAYKKIFGKSERAYNDSQKRKDRKIEDYYEKILHDKQKHPVYEMIVGVYPEKGDQIPEKEQRQILREFVAGWKKNNSHLIMIGAYYHADEKGQPHVHIDYVPVAMYKTGMTLRNGLTRALEQQGIKSRSKSQTAQILWEATENRRLEQICKEHGYEVNHPQRGKGAEHLSVKAFKVQKKLEGLQASVDRLNIQRDHVKNQLEEASRELVENGYKLRDFDINLSFREYEKAEKLIDIAESLDRER